MCNQTTLQDTTGATSSPGSDCGNSPCNGQAGPPESTHGPAVVPVNRSRVVASAEKPKIVAISGRSFFGSFPPDDLNLCLANRFRERTESRGSTLFRLTWKAWITASGRSIYALRASAHRNDASDCIGWPTPCAMDGVRGAEPQEAKKSRGANTGRTINDVAAMVRKPLASPLSRDHKDTVVAETRAADTTPRQAALVSGTDANGLNSRTAGVQLNPELSRWLQGIPRTCACCAPTVMPSSPNWRQNLSQL